MKKNNKGFTLAELLIVVAIIAVLVAVAIPVFTAQLEKSKEGTDIANVRNAYAEVVTMHLTDDAAHSMTVSANQDKSGWNYQSGQLLIQSGGTQTLKDFPAKLKGSTYTVAITASGEITVS